MACATRARPEGAGRIEETVALSLGGRESMIKWCRGRSLKTSAFEAFYAATREVACLGS